MEISAARVAANLLAFGRRLRAAGLPVGSGQVLGLVEAVAAVDVRRRFDVYHAARATLVTRPEQIPVFDAEFARFWRRLAGAEPPALDAFVATDAAEELPRDAGRKRTDTKPGAAGHPERDRTVIALA